MVIALTEPQIWTLIGVFAASLTGMLTLICTLFIRVIRAEIGGLRSEVRGEIGGLRAEMSARFETVNHRLDGLDRDVQALTRRHFGE